MMQRRLGLMNKKQRGFTIIEVLIAMALGGIICAAVGTLTYQTFTNIARDNAHMVAIKQVESAVHSVSRDIQMAQDVDTQHSGVLIYLTWTDWNNNVNVVTYTLVGSDLYRNYSLNGHNKQAVVAQHIESIGFTPKPWGKDKVTMTISAVVNGNAMAGETRVCDFIPRPAI
jgi:prepilin-type N-terminal cleavage/methylation domain-containing protein